VTVHRAVDTPPSTHIPFRRPSTPTPIRLMGPVPRFITSPHLTPRVVLQHYSQTPIMETTRPFKHIVIAHRRQPTIPPLKSPQKELPPTPAPSRQGLPSHPHLHHNPSTQEPFLTPLKTHRTHPHLPPPPPPSGQAPRLRFTSLGSEARLGFSHSLSSSALPPPSTRSWSMSDLVA
jgi:hypothetical protein